MSQPTDPSESFAARTALCELMQEISSLPSALACAEGAGALLQLHRQDATPPLLTLCWQAGRMAWEAYPNHEPIATAWTHTLCLLTTAYGSHDLLQETFRCQEEREAVAARFPHSEGVQYWNAQSNFEMVTVLAQRGYPKSIPIYLDNLRTLSRTWRDRAPFSALYAMALANAAAAYAQLQEVPAAHEQLDDLRALARQNSDSAEVLQAYARGLQQVAWYCGELVTPLVLHGLALELAELLTARSIRRECGPRAVAELGVYAAYFAHRGELAYAADALREACRWLEAVALDPEQIPMVVETFRSAAGRLRLSEPELAALAEARTERLMV
jgi:hypothetical protein